MLGAVRDGGRIPWDYDLDVMVAIDDREKLIESLEKELGKEFYYVYKNNLSKYPTSCLRICKKGYIYTTLHVDVFFLVGCPSDDDKRKKFVNTVIKLNSLRQTKYRSIWFEQEENKSILGQVISFLKKIREKLIPIRLVDLHEEKLLKKYKLKESKYCLCVGDMRYRAVYDTVDINKTKTVRYNDFFVCIPEGYHNILTLLYKDYSSYPNVSSRVEEFYGMLKIINTRQQLMNRSHDYDVLN
jgi:lipopolysaccharide cholinephosphotransferase